MSSDDLRSRIEALNRAPLRNSPDPDREESPEIKSLRRKLRKHISDSQAARLPLRRPHVLVNNDPNTRVGIRDQASATGTPGLPCSLEEAIEGSVIERSDGGRCYLVEKRADAFAAEAAVLFRRFVSLTGHPDGPCVDRLAEVCRAERVDPRGVLFMDLETTGLGTTPIFLVGTMECLDDGFVFRQYFARDYSEEAAIIAEASGRLESAGLLVTFNGKSFDMPYLQNRATATGIRLSEPRAHIDILHEARRLYRGQIANCKLQTLESAICGRQRDEDIPGSEIPAAYHEFVRTGDARKMSLILTHNLHDLLTMADLMYQMWRTR